MHTLIAALAAFANLDTTKGAEFGRGLVDVGKAAKAAMDAGETVDMGKLSKDVAKVAVDLRKLEEQRAVQGAGADHKIMPESELRAHFERDGQFVLRGKAVAASEGGWQPGLLDDDAPLCGEWHKELREHVNRLSIVGLACAKDRDPVEYVRQGGASAQVARLARHVGQGPESFRKMFSGGTGLGTEWTQTLTLPKVAEDLRLPNAVVEDLFEQVPMGAATVQLPVATGLPAGFLYGQPTTPAQYTAGDVATAQRTLTAKGIAVLVPIFDDASEDSVADAAGMISNLMVEGIRASTVNAIINADTAGQDTLSGWNPRSIFSGSPVFGGSNDPRKAWIGLRAQAFDGAATRDASADTTWSTQTVNAAMLALKAPHGVSGDLVYLTGLEHFLLKIVTDTNLLTLDKYGPNATIVRGEVGSLYSRVRVVVSELVTADLAASGLYTGSGSKSTALTFNRKRWVIGVRKGINVEAERRVIEGTTYLVAVRRVAFKSLDATTDKSVHAGINLATS